jgi:ribonuclease P protein component
LCLIGVSKPTIQAENQRFLRQYRLLTPQDYQAVFDAACRVSGQHLAMLAKPNQLGYSRLGFIVSKKQVRTAVARNRIKRVLRESFRTQQRQVLGLDVVVIVYKGLAALTKSGAKSKTKPKSESGSQSELQACIGKQWERLRARFGIS